MLRAYFHNRKKLKNFKILLKELYIIDLLEHYVKEAIKPFTVLDIRNPKGQLYKFLDDNKIYYLSD